MLTSSRIGTAVVATATICIVLATLGGCSAERRVDKRLKKARIYQDAQQLTLAATEFEQALEIDPNNIEGLFGLATVRMAQNRYEEAIPVLKRVVSLDPSHTESHYQLGLAYAARKDYESLETFAESLVESDVFEGMAYNFLGIIARQQGNTRQAIEMFSLSTQKDPDVPEAWMNLAEMQESKRDYAAVESTARAGLEQIGPDQHELQSKLALALVRQGKMGEAAKTLLVDIEHHPQLLDSRVRLGNLYMQANKFEELRALGNTIHNLNARSPFGKFFIGVADLEDRKYEKSVQALESVITTAPELALPHLYLALAQEQTGLIQQAITNARRFLDAVPDSVSARIILSRLYARISWLDEARNTINEAASLAPSNPEVLAIRGAIAMGEQDYASAMKDFEEMVEQTPENIRATLSLALVSLGRKDADTAIDYARQALTIDASDPRPHHVLGLALLQKAEIVDAIVEMKKSCELQPGFLPSRKNLARIYAGLGRLRAAEKEYTAILDILPTSVSARTSLGYLRLARKQFDDAATILREVVDMHPDQFRARIALASAMAETGDIDGAIDLLMERVNEQTEAARIHFMVGRLEFGRKAYAKAAESFARTVEMDGQIISASIDHGLALMMNGRDREGAEVVEKARKRAPSSHQAILYETAIRLKAGQTDYAVRLLDELERVTGTAETTQNIVPLVHIAANNVDAARKAADLMPSRSARKDVLELVSYREQRPDISIGWLPAALALAERNWPDMALDAATQAIDEFDQMCLPYMVRLSIRLRLGDLEGALQDCKAVLEIRPDHRSAIDQASRIQMMLGQTDAAVALLEGAAKSEPDNPRWQQTLGETYFQTGDLDKAGDMFKRSLEMFPQNGRAANNLAYIYLSKNKNMAEAVSLAKKASELLPMDGNVMDTLGWAYFKNGEFKRMFLGRFCCNIL